MTTWRRCAALGLMSGTSLDGVDVALVETDGVKIFALGPFLTVPYSNTFRKRLKLLIGERPSKKAIEVERELTLYHAEAVDRLLGKAGITSDGIEVIGFHGQTVLHDPTNRISYQIGDASLLASETGIDVVSDFRAADLLAGGEGAPLAPIFHVAMTQNLRRPLAVLNMGGVANVTWINSNDEVIAFDTGPANALIDDWVWKRAGISYDHGGKLAGSGNINEAALTELLNNSYFERQPPKSLDRNAFSIMPIEGLSLRDGAATLTAFTAMTISRAQALLPAPPLRWLVSGGGRLNQTLMAAVRRHLSAPVEPVEMVGWNGDALEAQAFGYLAVRSLCRLPLSYPKTTGARHPVTGGVFNSAIDLSLK